MKGLTLEETRVEVGSDGVCIVRLHRPDKGNAYTDRMADELDWIFRALSDDPAVRVIVVAGSGSRFCVGADLGGGIRENGLDGLRPGAEKRDLGGVATLSVLQCRKPVIAAIHGAAVGIGITLPLVCDLRVAEEDTKVSFPFAKRGLSTEALSSFTLPRIVGHAKALELCLLGRVFAARDEPTLFTQVVPRGQALPRALELARELLQCSPVSLALIKASINSFAPSPLDAHAIESAFIQHAFVTEAPEGFLSFMEKRPAVWKSSARDADAVIDKSGATRPLPPTRRAKL